MSVTGASEALRVVEEKLEAPARRVRPEHVTLSAIASFLLVGGGGFMSSRDLSAKLDQATHELAEVRVTLGEIKTQAIAADKGAGAVQRELERALQQLHDDEKALERSQVRQDELERRVQVLEGRK